MGLSLEIQSGSLRVAYRQMVYCVSQRPPFLANNLKDVFFLWHSSVDKRMIIGLLSANSHLSH